MWSGFQAKKFNTRGEHELDHAQNQAEPENQAGLVPDSDPEENFENWFLIKSQPNMDGAQLFGAEFWACLLKFLADHGTCYCYTDYIHDWSARELQYRAIHTQMCFIASSTIMTHISRKGWYKVSCEYFKNGRSESKTVQE